MSKTMTSTHPAGPVAQLVSAAKAALLPSAGEPHPPEPASPGSRRRDDALAVLTAARGVVGRGWVQRTWYVTETPAGRRPARHRFLPGRLDHSQVTGACLVGAVLHGAWQQSPRPEHAYPAIDALWLTLFDAGTPTGADPVGPLCPPLVRAARVRDLTTWNDRDHRSREDVLRLLDRAAARVTQPRPHVDA
ncbi:hypothetical protein ACIA5D_37420 [Actinoplanes sp. NPDC051513]|uniref:DUF6197 family protein n=1 Tax=Actinoplanes sp. NPDC051513 TaxID=3363908 RepID=UPI0037AD0A94